MTRTVDELRDLAELLGAEAVRARPYRYATSWSLEELEVVGHDGRLSTLLLKDFDDSRMLAGASRSRPRFLRDAGREIEVYRGVLAPNGIGPRLHASVNDAARRRWWLVCERVRGVELWQTGDVSAWESVARWLAGMHRAFVEPAGTPLDPAAKLLRFDADWFGRWAQRARTALTRGEDPRAVELIRRLGGFDEHVRALAALPVTFVHGELYPSNVMVCGDGLDVRVCPVDWEMAGRGPALLDLAALLTGWEPCVEARLVAAYGDVNRDDLRRCRLHLALQWIGWSTSWQPPSAHARDWVGEALTMARELS